MSEQSPIDLDRHAEAIAEEITRMKNAAHRREDLSTTKERERS